MKEPAPLEPPLLERLTQAIRSVRFGTVQVVIQDAQVVRIEKTEKIRLDLADRNPGGRK